MRCPSFPEVMSCLKEPRPASQPATQTRTYQPISERDLGPPANQRRASDRTNSFWANRRPQEDRRTHFEVCRWWDRLLRLLLRRLLLPPSRTLQPSDTSREKLEMKITWTAAKKEQKQDSCDSPNQSLWNGNTTDGKMNEMEAMMTIMMMII